MGELGNALAGKCGGQTDLGQVVLLAAFFWAAVTLWTHWRWEVTQRELAGEDEGGEEEEPGDLGFRGGRG